MSFWEMLVLGIGLSMDAAAVSMTVGMTYGKASRIKKICVPTFFAIFQALMPILGYFAGMIFINLINKREFISRFSGIVVCTILGVLGIKMLIDTIKEIRHPSSDTDVPELTYKLILLQAIATSIDAFAVGLGFSTEADLNIAIAIAVIGISTLLICAAFLIIGKYFGDFLGSKAKLFGAILLILLAIKSLF